jgi:hypothetical protein
MLLTTSEEQATAAEAQVDEMRGINYTRENIQCQMENKL